MEVPLSRRIAVSLVVAVVAVMLATMAALVVMMVSAEPAQAKHGDVHRSQPLSPPGNPDSGIPTGRQNQNIKGDR